MEELPSVLVAGDSFIDIFLTGKLAEAEDARAFKTERMWMAWGGAANVAWCLQRTAPHVQTSLIWPYVHSEFAAWAKGVLDLPSHYPVHTTAPLQVRMRLSDGMGRIMRIDYPHPGQPYYFSDWQSDIERALTDKRWLAIILTDHGYLTEMFDALVSGCVIFTDNGTILIYDCNTRVPPPMSLVRNRRCVIKANEAEIRQWSFLTTEAEWLIVTRQTKPTQLFVSGSLYGTYEIPAEIATQEWQYSGAGDAFVAALTQVLIRQETISAEQLEEGIKYAQYFVLRYMSRWAERYVEVSG